MLKPAAVVCTIMECPACGSNVIMEVGPEHPPSASLVDALITADEDERVEISRTCWECGWQEERLVRIDTIEGDDQAVERAALINDIMTEVAAIDSLATLEDALAEVRRQRRLDSDVSSTATDTTPEN